VWPSAGAAGETVSPRHLVARTPPPPGRTRGPRRPAGHGTPDLTAHLQGRQRLQPIHRRQAHPRHRVQSPVAIQAGRLALARAPLAGRRRLRRFDAGDPRRSASHRPATAAAAPHPAPGLAATHSARGPGHQPTAWPPSAPQDTARVRGTHGAPQAALGVACWPPSPVLHVRLAPGPWARVMGLAPLDSTATLVEPCAPGKPVDAGRRQPHGLPRPLAQPLG
jgi:hypothetical protein